MESPQYGTLKSKIPWVIMLSLQGIVTPEILNHKYKGAGTLEKPYLTAFFEDDPRDPMEFPSWLRWCLCIVVGYITFCVAFISSAYASGIPEISKELGGSVTMNTLGMGLFVLGFFFGPFIWAPTSELYGRRYIFILSTTLHFILNVAICFCQRLELLVLLRFLSGAFGSAPLTNSGGVIADTFPPKTRGLAITLFALVPLFGPVLGPIVGGFVTEKLGWRWLMGIMAALSASSLVISLVALPETYAPVLLRKRAESLNKITGRVYVSAMAVHKKKGMSGLHTSLLTTLSRPLLLAVYEPIVLLLAFYQAIVFGTVYLMFAAFPIVFNEGRGWSQGFGGLAFLGVLVGTLLAVPFQLWDNHRYVQLLRRISPDAAPPEVRLPGCCIGSVSIVIGLFWFAWTNGTEFHWIVSTAAGIPFGFGVVLITIGSTNYLVDAYTIYAASVLTVCICGRAVFGATFPLFTRAMYARLGIHWGSCIPAFLALVCTPFPFLIYRFGHRIRARCRYAAQAEEYLRQARRPARADELLPLLEED